LVALQSTTLYRRMGSGAATRFLGARRWAWEGKSDLLSLTPLLLRQSNLISRLALFRAGDGGSFGIPHSRAKMTGASRLDKGLATKVTISVRGEHHG
jgi:hypothetical protein